MIQIDMPIPEKCGLCPCFHHDNPMYCQAVKADKNKKIVNPYGSQRPEWCPLKEQEAENGDWITIWREDDPDTSTHARCSICNRISERPLGGYCKWCGAKMNQEWGVDG